jgi:hypothetical protein
MAPTSRPSNDWRCHNSTSPFAAEMSLGNIWHGASGKRAVCQEGAVMTPRQWSARG